MAFHVFLLAGSVFSLNLFELTTPDCNNELDCPNNEFRSCCEGICNAWKYCNGTCVTNTDCDLHELCVDKMCSANLNTTKKPTKKSSHIRLRDYLICIGFVMGLFLFQLGLPLLYIYKDKVAFCLKCKWLWNKEGEDEEIAPSPQQVSRRWPLFGWSLAYPTAHHYSRLSQLDDSCSFESEIYTESRNPEQNLEIVQRQVENVFGVPPPIYTNQSAAGEMTSDTSENISTSNSQQAESCSDQTDEPRPTNTETEEMLHSESDINVSNGSQEIPNTEEVTLTRAEQQFNLALSIPPPYERARFAPPDDDQTHETGFYSPAIEIPDDLNVESSLKKLFKLPSYNSINKISEETECLPPSYSDVLED